jgi:O-antigen/teichoic acid export membrane protein
MGILPVTIVVSFFSKEIIVLVYGHAYLPSAAALSMLIWSLFLIFLNAPVGNIIATSKLIHAFLPYAVGNTLLNIVLNFFLIPRYSFLGASFTTVLTECTGFAVQLWFANRVLGNASHILRVLGKLVAAGLVTSLTCYVLKPLVIVPLNILIVCAVYLGCVFVFKVVGDKDKHLWHEIIAIIRTKLSSHDR